MKSEHKWSEEQVEELLTTFFRNEVPAGLQGPMPVLADTRPVAVASQPAGAGSWSRIALAGCALALLLTIGFAIRPGTDGSSISDKSNVPEDRANVGTVEVDDFHAPEQDIELLDGEAD